MTNETPRTPTAKWRHLPQRVRPEDMVEVTAIPAVPQSTDATEQEWVVRYGVPG